MIFIDKEGEYMDEMDKEHFWNGFL